MSKSASFYSFDVDPQQRDHYFLVTIPASTSGRALVVISEHYGWEFDEEGKPILPELGGKTDEEIKVALQRFRWDDICEEVKAEFNRRLRERGLKTGRWLKKGKVAVDRSFGKELVLLAWAIEDAEFSLIPTAIRNWRGLAPEERWWLYTMTNAATGHAIHDRGKGWRKAVRYALTENPISDSPLHQRHKEFKLLESGLEEL